MSTFLSAPLDTARYVTLPRFPKVEQDICFKVPADVTFHNVYTCVYDELVAARPERTLSTVSLVDIYQRDDDAEHKQVTLRFSIASYDKTMTDVEVATLLGGVSDATIQKLGAEII